MPNISANSAYLNTMEEAVEEIQNKKNIDGNLELIKNMINREFKANCIRVYLTNNISKDYFFGCHVFPSESEIFKIADKVIESPNGKVKFETCKEFLIELDSKLVYDLNSTPREIVAILLHEIGHKVYSIDSQIRFAFLFMSELGKIAGIGAAIFKSIAPLKILLGLAIMNFFTSSLKFFAKNQKEIDADSLAVKYGYGADLYSIIDKLMDRKFANIEFMTSNEESERSLMKWSILNILDFSNRKNVIENTLKKQLSQEESEPLKKIIKNQLDAIDKIKKRNNVNIKEDYEQIKNESIVSFVKMLFTGKSSLELNELELELERMEDPEDKLYLLTRIERDMDIVNGAIHRVEKRVSNNEITPIEGQKEIKEFNDYKNELKKILEKVKNTKIKKKEFRVFVKDNADTYI